MRLSALVSAVAVLFSLAALQAQEAPSPSGPPPPSDAPAQVEQQSEVQTLKIGTNLVNVYFSARDKNGFLTNLKKADCTVLENKDPQVIKQFTQEKKLPLTIGILLDTSGSQQNVLPLEQESGATFLKSVLTPKDEAFLISFDINVDLLSDYTNSPRELKRAIDKAQINTGAGTGSVTGNGTARGTLLFDAVFLAAHDKLRQEAGRKVLVLLTDGGDQGSQETIKTATEAAQKANAIIYVILIADRGFYGGFGMGYSGDRDMEKLAGDTGGRVINVGNNGKKLEDAFDQILAVVADMEKLAGDTGGRVINVGNNGKKLEDAFDQIQDELRTQYLLSYTPKNLETDGKYRNISVDCGKGVKMQARKGYYAIPDSAQND